MAQFRRYTFYNDRELESIVDDDPGEVAQREDLEELRDRILIVYVCSLLSVQLIKDVVGLLLR